MLSLAGCCGSRIRVDEEVGRDMLKHEDSTYQDLSHCVFIEREAWMLVFKGAEDIWPIKGLKKWGDWSAKARWPCITV